MSCGVKIKYTHSTQIQNFDKLSANINIYEKKTSRLNKQFFLYEPKQVFPKMWRKQRA